MFKLLFKTFLFLLIIQTTLLAREINIDNIIKEATASSKHLFVWLHKTDCGYCESMKEFTLDDDAIKSLIEKKFLFVHINVYEKDRVIYKEYQGGGQGFAKLIGYNFYPTSLFFDSNKELIYAAPGYHDEKVFLRVLKYIDTKTYKKIDFETYENYLDFQEEL